MEKEKVAEWDVAAAKSYLLQTSSQTGINLYDHLATLLHKLLEERPNDPVDIFEEISREVKRNKFTASTGTIRDQIDRTGEVALADIQKKLMVASEGDEDGRAEEEDPENPLPNLIKLNFFFEQAGVGIGREETFRVWLALKNLYDTQQLRHVRFWGKLFGLEQSYYVAEAECREGDEEEESSGDKEESQEAEEAKDEDAEEDKEEDMIPKPMWKPPPKAPREEPGTGANKKVYFVCNQPGKPWVKLPHITPEQIFVARRIKKLLTGRLDAPIHSYPPFPGNEANYVRAQIGRISAGSHISPNNYYMFGEEEEEEEGAVRDEFNKNEDYQPQPPRDMLDLGNWVHHVLHLLPQGRTRWWNPAQKNEEEFDEEEEEEEEREEPEAPQEEVGPPLLNPLSEDSEVDGVTPWSAFLSSRAVAQHAVAVVRSNLWPGAYAFAHDKDFENVYVGWGHKFKVDNYDPPMPPAPLEEFPSGPEITEGLDPTPEEEAAVKAEQEGAEGADDEEEEEEADEENEDDD